MFWQTKESLNEEEFITNYEELKKYISSIGVENDIVRRELNKGKIGNSEELASRLRGMREKLFNYFITRYERKHERWADYHRHKVFNCGKSTTQFVESINAMLAKVNINGKSSVGDMVTEIFKYECRQEYNTILKSRYNNTSAIQLKNLTDGTKACFDRFICFIDTHLTSHGKTLQYGELHQSVDFRVDDWRFNNNDKKVCVAKIRSTTDPKQYTEITIDNGSKYACSRCEHSIGSGIVCRHYLCMIREGVDNEKVNAAFPIHAIYIRNQWFQNGLCKEATDMKELIYPLVRQRSIDAGVPFVDFNPLVVCEHQSTHVLKDSAGSIIDAEEICTYNVEYDADSNKRMNNAYAVCKPEFM